MGSCVSTNVQPYIKTPDIASLETELLARSRKSYDLTSAASGLGLCSS